MNRNRPLSAELLVPFLLLSLAAAFFTSTPSASADIAADSSASAATVEYNRAKDYYYLLLRDPVIQGERRNWLRGVRDFRRLYLEDPKGELAPKCLFMMAKMYYRMFMHFNRQTDLHESISYYSNVWKLFPRNTLADDALFWSASIYLKDKKDPGQAAALYGAQIKRYPDGDKYAQAISRLREIQTRHNIDLPRKVSVPVDRQQLVNVLPVKYWSSNDYARIVIRSSGPVSYTSSLADREGSLPRRLYIDFSQSTIAEKYTAPVRIEEGLLQRIKSSQHDPATVRVAFELESISSYKIFSLNDPFRVILDVHGQQQVMASAKPLPRFREEPVPQVGDRQAAGTIRELEPTGRKIAAGAAGKEEPKGEGAPLVVLDERVKKKPGIPEQQPEQDGVDGLSLAQQLGLGVHRIVIDPGHGGKDPGAMAHGLKEKDIALKVALKTAASLRAKYNYDVILTRNRDISLPLEERIAIANTRKADLFISIHVNAHPRKTTSGIETFYLNLATNTEAMRVAARENATSTLNISDLQDILAELMQNAKIEESSLLARFVQNSMISGLRQSRFSTRDLGVKQAPFYVLVGAKMPAILAEISFISNPQDAEKLRKEEYLDKIAGQIAAGVSGYVNHQATAALQM